MKHAGESIGNGCMKDGNYLNIPKPERKRFTYRIISVERLLELFETKQNVLVKPTARPCRIPLHKGAPKLVFVR